MDNSATKWMLIYTLFGTGQILITGQDAPWEPEHMTPQHPGLSTKGKLMANAELIHNVSEASPSSVTAWHRIGLQYVFAAQLPHYVQTCPTVCQTSLTPTSPASQLPDPSCCPSSLFLPSSNEMT